MLTGRTIWTGSPSDGTSDLDCVEGWSFPETGHRWSVGRRSVMRLQVPAARCDLVLELTLGPAFQPQPLVVSCGGRLLGRYRLHRPTRLAWVLPQVMLRQNVMHRSLGDRGTIDLLLGHPEFVRPCDVDPASEDTRELAFTMSRLRWLELAEDGVPTPPAAVAPDLQAIACQLESLGDNCELGIVQRQIGVEPLGLFRWSGSTIHDLLEMLDAGFEGLDDPDQVELVEDAVPSTATDAARGAEYLVRHKRYGLQFHSQQHVSEIAPARLHRQEVRKLTILRRKLVEDMQAGRKLYVTKRNVALTDAEVLPLWLGLREHGPCALLYVLPADARHPAGTLEPVRQGLMRGYVECFAAYDMATSVALESWIVLLRRAHAHWRSEATPTHVPAPVARAHARGHRELS